MYLVISFTRVFRGFKKGQCSTVSCCFVFFSPLEVVAWLGNFSNFSAQKRLGERETIPFFFFRKPTKKDGQKPCLTVSSSPRNLVMLVFIYSKPQVHQPFVCEIWGGFGVFLWSFFQRNHVYHIHLTWISEPRPA